MPVPVVSAVLSVNTNAADVPVPETTEEVKVWEPVPEVRLSAVVEALLPIVIVSAPVVPVPMFIVSAPVAPVPAILMVFTPVPEPMLIAV